MVIEHGEGPMDTVSSTALVDERAIFRNGYNRISNSDQDTKRERNTNTKDGIKYKTSQAESQEDSSLPAESYVLLAF